MSFQRFQCEVESKQPDTRLAQDLRHKSTVSLPPNLTECSLNHFMPALRLLKPHVKKKQYQPKLMSPRVLHTLNFEECQFFHPDPKTPSQKHYKIACSRNANLNFLFPVESIKHLVMTILPTKYKKSLQAHLSQQEQSNNEICYRPAERNCFTVLAN